MSKNNHKIEVKWNRSEFDTYRRCCGFFGMGLVTLHKQRRHVAAAEERRKKIAISIQSKQWALFWRLLMFNLTISCEKFLLLWLSDKLPKIYDRFVLISPNPNLLQPEEETLSQLAKFETNVLCLIEIRAAVKIVEQICVLYLLRSKFKHGNWQFM